MGVSLLALDGNVKGFPPPRSPDLFGFWEAPQSDGEQSSCLGQEMSGE
jgi:hypothetical protein